MTLYQPSPGRVCSTAPLRHVPFLQLLGLPEEEDWILNAPYADRSALRNVLIYELVRGRGRYASRHRYCNSKSADSSRYSPSSPRKSRGIKTGWRIHRNHVPFWWTAMISASSFTQRLSARWTDLRMGLLAGSRPEMTQFPPLQPFNIVTLNSCAVQVDILPWTCRIPRLPASLCVRLPLRQHCTDTQEENVT